MKKKIKKKKRVNLNLLVCPYCGSDNVSMEAWVNINTNKFIDDMGSDANQTCDSCEENSIRVITLKEYNAKKKEENKKQKIQNRGSKR